MNNLKLELKVILVVLQVICESLLSKVYINFAQTLVS